MAWKNGRLDFGVGDVCGQHTVLSYQDADPPLEVSRMTASFSLTLSFLASLMDVMLMLGGGCFKLYL